MIFAIYKNDLESIWLIKMILNWLKVILIWNEIFLVLPKFEVKLEPPSVAIDTDDLVVGINAKYTYGKGVQGRATVLAEYPYYYSDEDKKERPPIEKGIDVRKFCQIFINAFKRF